MRVIDADALMDIVEQQGYVTVDDIINSPTIEVEPVVHGRWAWFGGDEHRCSVCGGYVDYECSTCRYNYCPHCGAKMDGGAENA